MLARKKIARIALKIFLSLHKRLLQFLAKGQRCNVQPRKVKEATLVIFNRKIPKLEMEHAWMS